MQFILRIRCFCEPLSNVVSAHGGEDAYVHEIDPRFQVYNAVQGSDSWVEWMGNPGSETIGGVNTAYSVCAIIGGWFLAAPTADILGRKMAMAIGSLLIIIGATLETFTTRHTLGMFIAGRAFIGLGQGIALSAGPSYIGEITPHRIRGIVMTFWQVSAGSSSCTFSLFFFFFFFCLF